MNWNMLFGKQMPKNALHHVNVNFSFISSIWQIYVGGNFQYVAPLRNFAMRSACLSKMYRK